jgi:hypothetical protein
MNMQITNWPNIFVDQDLCSDPDFISGTHHMANVQFADKHVLDVPSDVVYHYHSPLQQKNLSD